MSDSSSFMCRSSTSTIAAVSWGVSQPMWEWLADVRARSAVRRTRRSGESTAAMTWGNAGVMRGLQWGVMRAWLQAEAAQRARVLLLLLLLLLLLEAAACCSSCTTRSTAGAEPPDARVPRSSAHCTSHVTCHTSNVTRHTSHVTRHMSHVTRQTSHVTCHTSHVTHHKSLTDICCQVGEGAYVMDLT